MDGRFAASGALDGGVKVWDVNSGNLLHTLEGPGGAVEWLCWHSKGNILLVGSADGCSYMWTAATATLMGVFAGHGAGVNCGMFTPDGKRVVTGSADHSLRVWNPKDQTTAHTITGGNFHTAPVNVVACRSDNTLVLTGSEDNTARVVNIVTNKLVGTLLGHRESVECVAFSATTPFSITGSMDGTMNIWDLNTLQARSACEHGAGVTRVVPHPTRPLIATGSVDGVVRIWDDRTGACVRRLHGHKDVILELAFSLDGTGVISGSDDKTCLVFDVAS